MLKAGSLIRYSNRCYSDIAGCFGIVLSVDKFGTVFTYCFIQEKNSIFNGYWKIDARDVPKTLELICEP